MPPIPILLLKNYIIWKMPLQQNTGLKKEKDQKPFGFWSWSECRDSNSRPLEPHFYGLFSIQRFLEAFCGILSTKTNKLRTSRVIIKISKKHSSENW